MQRVTRIVTSVLLMILPPIAHAEDWSQFRGPNCSGRTAGRAALPTEIGPGTNVVWKTALPPGHSSPIVVGDRIYVTAVRDQKLLTIALDRATGKILWEAAAPTKILERVHKIGSLAQPSPTADEERVVSFFGSCGLFCYDRAGQLLWSIPMGPFKNDFGAGSSPILAGDRVILCQDHDEGSFLTAFNKKTGTPIWRTERSEFLRGYCTPVLWESGGKKQIVVAGTLRVVGYDFETGKEIWTVYGISRTVCMTPVVGDDGLLYVAGWSAGGDAEARIAVEPFDAVIKQRDKNANGTLEREELDGHPYQERFAQVDTNKDGSITRAEYERFRELFQKGQNVVLAIRSGGKGDVTHSHVVWRNTKQVPFCASPLYAGDCLFTLKDGGFLSSLDAKDGKLIQRDRLAAGGNYYSSPVAGDGKVYLVNDRGRLTVVSAARDWQVLARSDFDEDTYATPAIVEGRIYLRTASHLYCFGIAGKK
jgi:outer membrane protein assembly factor BamB